MRWVDALKEYAKKNGKYVVPKKGSKEYDEVRAIMGASKGEAKADVAKAEAPKMEEKADKAVERTGKVRKPRAKKAVAVAAEGTAAAVAPAKVKKERKPRAKKAVEGVSTKSQNALDAHPRRGRRQAKEAAGSVPAGMEMKGATEKAVAHSKNPEAVLEQMTNAHLPVNPSGKVPALRLPKGVAFDSEAKLTAGEMEMPSLVEKSRPVSAAPFSFNAIRRQLGA